MVCKKKKNLSASNLVLFTKYWSFIPYCRNQKLRLKTCTGCCYRCCRISKKKKKIEGGAPFCSAFLTWKHRVHLSVCTLKGWSTNCEVRACFKMLMFYWRSKASDCSLWYGQYAQVTMLLTLYFFSSVCAGKVGMNLKGWRVSSITTQEIMHGIRKFSKLIYWNKCFFFNLFRPVEMYRHNICEQFSTEYVSC